jgi:hypothetical protein
MPQEHLIPMKTGDPAPPNAGRKRGSISIPQTLRKILEVEVSLVNPLIEMSKVQARDDLDEKVQQKTIREWMCIHLTCMAMEGNLKAMEMIMDRVEGKPSQSVEVSTKTIDIIPTEISEKNATDAANIYYELMASKEPNKNENLDGEEIVNDK